LFKSFKEWSKWEIGTVLFGIVFAVLIIALSPYIEQTTGLDMSTRGRFRLFGLIAVFFIIGAYINTGVKKKRINEILRIKAPDDKIRAINEYMAADKVLNKSDADLKWPYIEYKISLLNWLALAYMSKGEYHTALEIYSRIAPLFGKMPPIVFTSQRLDVREMCVTQESQCLTYLGDFDGARRKLRPLMERVGQLNKSGRLLVLHASAELDAKCGDVQNARKTAKSLVPEYIELARKYNNDDIRYDGILLDAVVNKAEGNFEFARQEFEDIIRNCGNAGNVYHARKELEEIQRL